MTKTEKSSPEGLNTQTSSVTSATQTHTDGNSCPLMAQSFLLTKEWCKCADLDVTETLETVTKEGKTQNYCLARRQNIKQLTPVRQHAKVECKERLCKYKDGRNLNM